MASPNLQSFCCTPNDSYIIVSEDPPNYRTMTFNIICIAASSFSVLGVIYQLLPRRRESARRLQQQPNHKKIIGWLAVADLLAAIGLLVRSAVWLSGEIPQYDPLQGNAADFPHIFCAVISAWIQFFYMCTYFWTLCYAVDIHLFISDKSTERLWLYKVYHVTAWGVSAILCSGGLVFLYVPDLLRCQLSGKDTLPHYLFTYIPILVVMVANPLLYLSTSHKLKKKLSGQAARFTDNERRFLRAVKTKFLLVVVVFYICWSPNIINGIMLWNHKRIKRSAFVGIWTFMTIVNPLQALLNSCVYRGVAGCNFRLPHVRSTASGRSSSMSGRSSKAKETTRLLDSYSALTT